MFDLLITRCRIVDGSGGAAFEGDVAVLGDTIAAVGDLDGASRRTRIAGDGLVLAPGFIDAHVHTDADLFRNPAQEASLRQGVTTHVIGQDGFGFAPTTPSSFDFMRLYTAGINGARPPLEAGSVGQLLDRVDGACAVNAATLVPNGCLRLEAVGSDGRAATADELDGMAGRCAAAMREGAVGLSSGLDYVPSGHATTAELAALCAATRPFGGVYVTHVRYRDGLVPALREAIEIGRRAAVPVHVSHLRPDRATGPSAAEILAVVDEAATIGVDVTFDLYPYAYGSTVLTSLLPAWLFDGDRAAIVARLRDPAVRAQVDGLRPDHARATLAGRLPGEWERLVGLDLPTAARAAGLGLVDLACDLLLGADFEVALVWKPSDDSDAEDELARMLRHPAAMLGSDGIYSPGRVHPRGYGAFARFVGRLVRGGLLPLERAVERVTSVPARRFGLAGRGLVREGHAADFVLFDPATLVDRATFEHGDTPAAGVRDVVVNGVPVLRDGAPTGLTPGRGLRRGER